MKDTLKLVLAHVLYYAGILHAWQAVVLRRKAIVLMYHRVLTAEERRASGSHPAIVVDRDLFARHMALLKRRFRVLSLEEFANRIENRIPFPSSSCFITFDDGWRDNFTNAWPVLRAHSFSALVFLPVNYIGSGRLFWREALTNLLVRAVLESRRDEGRRARLVDRLQPLGFAGVLDVSRPDPRPAIIDFVEATRDRVDQRVFDVLAAELGPLDADGVDGFLDWDQVRAMAREGIAFGGHTADHRILPELTDSEISAQVDGCKEKLKDLIGRGVPAFSYPNGDWTPETVEHVRRAGYRLAFTTRAGRLSCDEESLTIRRINIDSKLTHTPLFLARVLGLF